MDPARRFEVVEEREDPTPDLQQASAAVLLALKTLSQRFVLALASLFSLITVATVFWLALAVVPQGPSVRQLVGLGGYGVFVLAVNWIVRRER